MKGPLAEERGLFVTSPRMEGCRVGKVVEVDAQGSVLVDFPGNTRGPAAARFTSSFLSGMGGQAPPAGLEVLLVFENNDPELPVIVDTVHSAIMPAQEQPGAVAQRDELDHVLVDGKRVTFDAKEQIELRCGKASIILTRAGKVLIKGAYLLNRSSGVNRIKGGSVQIN